MSEGAARKFRVAYKAEGKHILDTSKVPALPLYNKSELEAALARLMATYGFGKLTVEALEGSPE